MAKSLREHAFELRPRLGLQRCGSPLGMHGEVFHSLPSITSKPAVLVSETNKGRTRACLCNEEDG